MFLEVEAGVEQEEAVVVLHEHAVHRQPHLLAGDVPHPLGVLDEDRAVIEQPDLHGHDASSALRTPMSLAARWARSSSIRSGVYS